jgi:hypothetical protein
MASGSFGKTTELEKLLIKKLKTEISILKTKLQKKFLIKNISIIIVKKDIN